MIDFSICDFTEYTEENILKIIEEHFPIKERFFSNSRKIIFELEEDSCFIYKIFFNKMLLEQNLILFKKAQECFFDNIFLEYEVCFSYDSFFITKQKKAITLDKMSENSVEPDRNSYLYFLIKKYFKNYPEASSECLDIFYMWMNIFLKTYGHNEVDRFLSFLIKNKIRDIWSFSNLALLDKKPVIIDYEDWGR